MTKSIQPPCSIHGIGCSRKTSCDGLANNENMTVRIVTNRGIWPDPKWSSLFRIQLRADKSFWSGLQELLFQASVNIFLSWMLLRILVQHNKEINNDKTIIIDSNSSSNSSSRYFIPNTPRNK